MQERDLKQPQSAAPNGKLQTNDAGQGADQTLVKLKQFGSTEFCMTFCVHNSDQYNSCPESFDCKLPNYCLALHYGL